MKITLLGTGTPTPSLKRASSGYLIEVGDDVIVMDHGPNAHQRLLESGRRAADVTHVFLSHLHYDHCMDYPRLVLQRWDIGAGRVPDLEVYGPPPLARMTELLFGADGVYGPDIRARIEHQGSIDIFEARGGKAPRARPNPRVTEVRPGEVIDGGGWKMTVGEASHVQPYLECYGYRLDSADGSLCYSGDSGGVCKGIIELAKGCDVLIHMNHYLSGTEPTRIYRAVCGNHVDTAKVAQQAGVKTLVLTHMLEQIDQPGVREQIIKETTEIYDGNVIWGEDLMEIPLHGPQTAKME
jgi:ribonuclease BN (tRNA processing enzyme)